MLSAHRLPRPLRTLLARSTLRKLALAFLLWTIIDAHLVYYRIAASEQAPPGHLPEPKPRVYIASLHYNNEKILRSEWNQGVLDLVDSLGKENVFVSILESGSWDDSPGALRELDNRLEIKGVPRKISLDRTSHEELVNQTPAPTEQGWVTVPSGERALRRIPYLSKLRNLSLQPLVELAENGTTFDYIVFLGDVVFTIPDIHALMSTNNGDYAAACSLDFSKPPHFYDTFALRDSAGHEYATSTWPYFRSSTSRKAMMRGDPVPVTSCWNGIVSMPAAPFYAPTALRFRGIDDSLAASHLEGSECCLIHADNPESRLRGVFLNPRVRVGYTRAAWDQVHPRVAGTSWLSATQVWTGLWKNRLARWLTTPWIKEQRVRGRIARWQRAAPESGKEEGEEEKKKERAPRVEKGDFCLINEMQVIVANGWAHL